MASILTPYLSFDGSCREAMEFYQSVFGGDLTINTFGEFGHADGEMAEHVMHAQLTTPQGYTLMASDQPEQMPLNRGDNISLSLSGDDEGLVELFEKLSDGGKIIMPLEKQVWGDEYGMLVDRFGIHWMVNRALGQG